MKRITIFLLILVLMSVGNAQAFWMWTPETNKWINPRYAVKETPSEQLGFALEFFNTEEYKEAISEFKKLIKYYPKAREAADAQFHIGLAQENQNLLFAAFKSYQLVIEKYPFSDRAENIVERQYEIGNRLLDGEDHRSKWVQTVVGAHYDVIEVFRTVIKNGPYGKYASLSQYKIGLYLQEKRLYQEARDEFEKVLNDYPDSEWAQAAKYQIALADANRSVGAQYDQAITETALDEFDKFVKQYPDAELSRKAQEQINDLLSKEAENNYLIAEFYEKQKNYKAAKIYYNSIVKDFRNTKWAQKSLEKIRQINEIIQ